MADIKFGPNTPAYYGDVTKADRPKGSGLTLVPINRYSGRPVVDTDVSMYGNKPGDVVERLYKDGIPAQGFINNKFYRDGQELSAEQVQSQRIENVIGLEGALATLGLRTPVGPGGEKFIRDTAAEKKFAATVRESAKLALKQGSTVVVPGVAFTARTGGMSDKEYANYLINASDEQIIANVGGVNKEGIPGSEFGINTKMPFPEGTINTQYVQGSRNITESDILALGKLVGNAANDPEAAAGARKQLTSIFENDSSFARREQARDALSYGLPGYSGGSKTMSTSGRFGGFGDADGAMTYTASDGRQFTSSDAYVAYQANLDEKKSDRRSAYDLLYQQFDQYGLGALVSPLKGLIEENISPSEFTLRLRETDAYKKRFAANTQRINNGLRALSEGEYIQLEDQYQDVMRRYGMPESYYKKGDLGIQQGFEKFIGGDVSPVELEDRIQTAQSRVFDANPEVAATLKQFYPGITNGDVLAYVLDPKSALPELKRKITAAEIGAGAKIAGLATGLERATELASYGVTKEQAQQGFQTIAEILPRGGQLASIYGEPAYTQTTAEQEVFGLAGATEAAKQRKKLTSLEQASFSGTSGMAGTALGRERAGQF